MKPPDKGLLLSSRVDFTIPSPFAREHLYYLIQYGCYQCVPGYEVKRDFLHVRVQHPEDWVISSAVDGKVDTSAWRFQPEKVGSSLCTNDLGTHAEQMVTQFTGLHVKRVLAMMDTYPRDLPLDTNVNVLMDFGGGVTGTLWASQIAIGHECDSGIYVIGTEGSLEWTATT